MRGGADLEMRWTATSKRWYGRDDAYGLMSTGRRADAGVLSPSRLVAQHVRCGDAIASLPPDVAALGIDGVVAQRR